MNFYTELTTTSFNPNTGFEYIGRGNVTYSVVAVKEFFLSLPLAAQSGGDSPFISARWDNGSGDVTARGVVINAAGEEVINFYRSTSDATASSGNTPVSTTGIITGALGSYNSLPAGNYTIYLFPLLSSGGSNVTGSGTIAVSGVLSGTNPITPGGSPTIPPTPTPSPTPLPTATPIPTATVTPLPTATPAPTPVPTNPVPAPIVPLGQQYTLSYSAGVQGWPSFFSFSPDYMIGMNNYFYSFSGGNLYRHNTNEVHNNYYGAQYNSRMTSVINKEPLTNKLFKTLTLQSNSSWSAALSTDIQNNSFISSNWFEKKEGAWFASVKNTTQVPAILDTFNLRSVNGIGRITSFSGPDTQRFFNLTVAIDSIISVGDYLYYNNDNTNTPALAGQISGIVPGRITVDATIEGSTAPTTENAFILAYKNTLAESHGILGHYCLFTIENTDTTATELFAVESQVMKSYP